VKTRKARSIAASATIELRTVVSAACAHPVLLRWLLDGRLVGRQCLAPEPLEVGAQRPEAFRVEPVDPPLASTPVHDEPRVLDHLRCCEAAGGLTGNSLASSPTARGRSARRSKIARLVGLPSAVQPLACMMKPLHQAVRPCPGYAALSLMNRRR
jgi:hypothetical protein